jgi:hypothetical protein
MNHKVLAIAPIVAVAALVLTAVGFAIPQQAFAGYGHHHYHHNNHSNSIDVDQQINQLNNCTLGAQCANDAQNHVDIDR